LDVNANQNRETGKSQTVTREVRKRASGREWPPRLAASAALVGKTGRTSSVEPILDRLVSEHAEDADYEVEIGQVCAHVT
jgi:hypothetical protein